jgi:tetratricopeptide (TPR) repeat protein
MEVTTDLAPLASMEEDIRRLRQLHKDGRHGQALEDARTRLREFPENRDLILIEAMSLRHLKCIDEALTILDRLEQAQPRFSLMHQERGLCHVARKDAGQAINALLMAVNINPALPMSWRMLEGIYRLNGDAENAATAAAHLATLRGLPPEVVTATSLYSDGELLPAEQIIRAFLLRYGDHPEAMRLLAKIGLARGVLDDAELLLEAVLILVPNHRAARLEYAQALLKRHKYREASLQAEKLLALESSNKDYLSLAATSAVGLGEHERSIVLYRAMLIDAPNNPDVYLWLGHALKTIDRVPDAIDAYRSAAASRLDFGDAYWSLANLKTYQFSDAEIDQMRVAEAAKSTLQEDRIHLCFALGKALEDRGEFAQSWIHYERGNTIKRLESRYRPESIEANTSQQIAVCTRKFFTQRAGWGVARSDPIFILGLPRSGSTLLEQILASHSLVEGTQELADIQRTVTDLMGRDSEPDNLRYPAVLTGLTSEEFRLLGERYLDSTAVYRTARPFFIDKMPNNFRHIGLIHLMLPNAKIIDARREPMSCCFSNLKQLFANGQEFTYGVEFIARYYRTYIELMRHWDEVLPERILRIHHEDVVADLEGSVRKILDYCGLHFEPACIDFHKTRRSVRTPSSEQVRQPIFREGLDQWKKYEPWLDHLKEALGDARFRYRT